MEEKKHPLNDLMSATMDKIQLLAGSNTVAGEPIIAGDVTILPISRLSFGFGVGGSDFASKNQKPDAANCFGGGSGAGVNVEPVAFLVIRDGNVRILPLLPPADGVVGRVVDMVPELVDKVTDFVEKQQEKKDKQNL